MRSILVLGFSVLALVAGNNAARAEITYPWCAEYGGRDGAGRNCGFWTYQQCLAALSGNNSGYCIANSMYRGPQPGMVPPPPGLTRRGSSPGGAY